MTNLNYNTDLIKPMVENVKAKSFVINFLSSFIIIFILYPHVPTIHIAIWFSIQVLLYVVKIFNYRDILRSLHTKDIDKLPKQIYILLLLLSLTALTYSYIIWISVIYDLPESHILILIVLFINLAAGAITHLGGMIQAFILYVFFIIFPIVIAMLYHGGELFNILSFILTVFLFIHISSGYKQSIILRNATSLKDSFETIFNKTSDGIVFIKNKRFKDCNDSIVKMFNLKSKKELLNTHLRHFSPKYQPDGSLSNKKMLSVLNKAWSEGSASIEWFHTTIDGKAFWTDIALTKINLNGEDLIHGVWKNISSKKEAEQKIETLNDTLKKRVSDQVLELTRKTILFETIFNTAKDGIAILDLESKFLLVNKAYQKMSGYSKEELYQTSCLELTAPEFKNESKKILNNLISIEHIEDYTKNNITKDGNIIEVKMDLTLMPDKQSILTISKDMTIENKLLEDKKEQEAKLLQHSKLAQMGEMISMIAHQWRQPLGAISSTTVDLKLKLEFETFDLGTKEGAQEATIYFNEKLEDIEHFVSNLTTTIDDFRDFYKPNKTAKTQDIRVPITKALKIIENSLNTDNIKITKLFTSNKEVPIFENEVMQVLLNILINAQDNFRIKDIEHATISIKCYDTNKGINLEICDNGGGIESEVLNKIFNPYFSTKHKKNGTGIGLYMSKMIIEEHHNGNLNAKNTYDGVCFLIELPDRII